MAVVANVSTNVAVASTLKPLNLIQGQGRFMSIPTNMSIVSLFTVLTV